MATCAKCGTENAAGDAFCGGCGAFLEFVAEEAADAASDGSVPDAASDGPAPATPAGPTDAAPAPTEAGGPLGTAPGELDVARAAQPSPSASAGTPAGPTCAACGRANTADRTFCIACGERLPGSAAPSRPGWDFPTAPVPTPAPAAAAPSALPEPRPGRSRLALFGGLIAILVLVGGGAFVVFGGGLGGGTPGPGDRTAAPGATAAANQSGEPTTGPATQGPGGEATPAPSGPAATIPPGPSIGIAVEGAQASSQLSATRAPRFLHDGSPATAWMSKSGAFNGSWIEITFPAAAVTRIQVWAGWQRDEPAYQGYRRPRNVTVSFDGGDPVPLRLQDVIGAQRVDIPAALGITAATRLRITVADTYPGRKTSASGTPAKQVAISEIRVFGVPVTP